MGALAGFGIRTYRVLIQYVNDGGFFEVEFGGVRATSVAKAKEQARSEFVSMLEMPEEVITHMFAVMVL
jgi:hypothetical protein